MRLISRIVYRVQYDIARTGFKCVPDYFTEFHEAEQHFKTIRDCADLYKNIQVIECAIPNNTGREYEEIVIMGVC
jgi:hypothetical protein